MLIYLIISIIYFNFVDDLLAHLVPHPQYKIVGLRSVPQEPSTSIPFSAHTWSGLLQSLKRMILYNTAIDESIYSVLTKLRSVTIAISLR